MVSVHGSVFLALSTMQKFSLFSDIHSNTTLFCKMLRLAPHYLVTFCNGVGKVSRLYNGRQVLYVTKELSCGRLSFQDTVFHCSSASNFGCEDDDEASDAANIDQEHSHGVDPLTVPSKGKLESGLYLVATPIGNLEDITLRALRVLKSADLILSEDTRHSAKLLQHYSIRTPSASYHKYNETKKTSFVLERLQHGGALALITDAGMPGISDPGAELVMACVDANIPIVPIPGPCAVITALVAAGLPTNEFSFVGFLSTQESQRKSRLTVAASESATQVLYVPPHKLCRVLEDCSAAFGSSRRCVVAREMTKVHEEFWRGTLEEAMVEFASRAPRGEITLVIQGLQKSDIREPSDEDIQVELQKAFTSGVTISEAAKLVSQKMSTKKKKVYDLALKLSGEK